MTRSHWYTRLTHYALASTLVAVALPLHAEEFPWWYTKLLSYHMPAWLIQVLQQPWTVIGTAGAILLLVLIIKILLAIKLKRANRDLARLKEEHARALHQIDTLKTVKAHQQTTIAHLSALIAHQAKQIARQD